MVRHIHVFMSNWRFKHPCSAYVPVQKLVVKHKHTNTCMSSWTHACTYTQSSLHNRPFNITLYSNMPYHTDRQLKKVASQSDSDLKAGILHNKSFSALRSQNVVIAVFFRFAFVRHLPVNPALFSDLQVVFFHYKHKHTLPSIYTAGAL